ncbi:CST complex subunit TEN1 [Corythoichthys intestinalis]|uniref:CST complex subunit TEN1 n=1 Tax=Corythoichthys intestinalis TaxID=161448 RepID=UPI0025A4FEC0|nr:CST complex subunit TEN1 [Corythoichthys intestinalis]XP_061791819.1 CST complex subunit TEN1-like [Nerophis lumbriciformis]
MLPGAAVYYFPWEFKPGALPDGASVRTFGRLACYEPEKSQASLTSQHASKEHKVIINTLFVEPFNPIIGAQYMVLGEIETTEEVGMRVCARVLNCVDGVNIALLQKAINEQRSFFKERHSQPEDVAMQNADAT